MSNRRKTQLVGLAAMGLVSAASAQSSLAPVACEMGLSPEAFVVAGFDAAQTERILRRAAGEQETLRQIASLRQEIATCTHRIASLRKGLSDAPGSRVLRGDLHSEIALARAKAGLLASLQVELKAASVEGVAAASARELFSCADASEHQTRPELWTVDRTDKEWQAVESALIEQRRVNRTGEELSAISASVLREALAHPKVVEGIARLSQNLESVKAVFNG